MAAAAFSSVAACSAASAFATSSFQSLAHFMSTHQTLRNDGGHTKNDDHFSHVLSRM